jgi:hypothetical protein
MRNLPADGSHRVEVRMYKGKPAIHVEGEPLPLPAYSPVGYRPNLFHAAVPPFAEHGMGAYFLTAPRLKNPPAWGESPFWEGDEIRAAPRDPAPLSLDEQAAFILERDPEAWFFVRNGPLDPPSWRALHPDQLVVNEAGERLDCPSLASDLHWEDCARATTAVIRYCEGRPFAHRLLGYWYGMRMEGTHEPLVRHDLYDHSPLMQERWRAFLRERYGGDVDALRAAHGDPDLAFETARVPCDPLRGSTREVKDLLYWQPATANRPLRDYLLLTARLYHRAMRRLFRASREATDRRRVFLYDALKQSMQGWTNLGFFHPEYGWPDHYAELMAGSGHLEVADLLAEEEGFGGLVTPHDYHHRGVGGVCEPEGCADSCVLRGKYFFCELDIRTFHDDAEHGAYGCARDAREFAAISWRDAASSITRGFNGYWMDLVRDWFSHPDLQASIGPAVEVLRRSLEWEHRTVPGIAMILDDQCVLETNGDGAPLQELVMWEWRRGLAHCGVPFRIYLLEDLALEQFPEHRVYYFPNLYRVDEERLNLVRRRCCRDGNVVVWGPGSGISDGATLGPEHAARLTGFDFHWLPVNHPRRFRFSNFDHPLAVGFGPDDWVGGPLAYGPCLYPADGTEVALAWPKQARNYAGLAVKEMGRGPRGPAAAPATLGGGDWASVFATAGPLPAGLWRNLARYAGAHVYSESDDVLLADSACVALHSVQSGTKRLALPQRRAVEDLVRGEAVSAAAEEIVFELDAPATHLFRLSEPAE